MRLTAYQGMSEYRSHGRFTLELLAEVVSTRVPYTFESQLLGVSMTLIVSNIQTGADQPKRRFSFQSKIGMQIFNLPAMKSGR